MLDNFLSDAMIRAALFVVVLIAILTIIGVPTYLLNGVLALL